MGTFQVAIEIGDTQGSRFEPLEARANTGSSYTWVPRDVLQRLGVPVQARWEFELANGQIIEREIAQTWVRYNCNSQITFAVFGDEGSSPLLGAYTLEGFRLAADPLNGRLVPVRGLAMRLQVATLVASSLSPEPPTR